MISCLVHRELSPPTPGTEFRTISVQEVNAVRFGISEDIEAVFSFRHIRPILGPISILIQSVSWDIILGIKRCEREAEHLTQFITEF